MATNTTHATAPALHPNLSYDPACDFRAIAIVAFTPNMAVIHPAVPASTLQEFIAHTRANPGSLSYGSGGVGTSQHLSAALLCNMARRQMTHVAYRGGAPAAVDLIAGRLQLLISPLVEVLPFIRERRVRAIGATTRQRHTLFPDIPTMGEILPGYEVTAWAGLFAPVGTPTAAVERLSREIVTVMSQPAMRRRVEELGSLPVAMGAAEAARFHAAELPKWAELVRISGARVE